VPIEPLKLLKEPCPVEIAVENAYGVVRVAGGDQHIARFLDGLQVAGGDLAGGADQGETLRVVLGGGSHALKGTVVELTAA
jgi:hypothetical protein